MQQNQQLNSSLFTRVFGNEVEENRYGTGSIVLLVIACLGGSVVGTGGLESTTQLLLAIFPIVIVMSLILAVQPMKLVLKVATPAIILQIAMIAYNVLFN